MLENLLNILKENNVDIQLKFDENEYYLFFPDITSEYIYMFCFTEDNYLKFHKRIGMEGYDYNLGNVNSIGDKEVNFLIKQYYDMKKNTLI